LIFIPYLFGTTWAGSRLVPEKSIIIPCLHDEPYARLSIFEEMFKRVRGMIFNSEPERALAQRLYGFDSARSAIAGMGVDKREEYLPDRFRKKFKIREPFLMCAGRREEGKNTPLLVEYFRLFKKQNPASRLKLVLIGTGTVDVEPVLRRDIIDLGFVDETSKHDAYAASFALCQPSTNESFSIVMMEAWLARAPCIVNAHCDVTAYHCRRSNGGLLFRDYFDFEESLLFLDENAAVRAALAGAGARYVADEFSWDTITKRYEEAFDRFIPFSKDCGLERGAP
jgi:glycosyltransferase involved in cell wall biosynthesis